VVDVQVTEQFVGKQPVAFGVQQPVDRPLGQVGFAALHRDVEQSTLALGQPQRHRPPSTTRNHISVILASQSITSESTPAAKDTTLLAEEPGAGGRVSGRRGRAWWRVPPTPPTFRLPAG
jgi:hypothetical protein